MNNLDISSFIEHCQFHKRRTVRVIALFCCLFLPYLSGYYK